MPTKTRSPWFWAKRNAWYVKIKGHRYPLGPDKAEADREFHRLMYELLGPEEKPPEEVKPDRTWKYVSEVVDEFQIFLQDERSEKTLDWYCQYLDPFKQQFLVTKADALTAEMVKKWVNSKWKTQPSRRAALRAVKAAFRKAAGDGAIPFSSVATMPLPGETARDYVVKKAEYEKVLAAIGDKTFTDLIKFVWLTGSRPEEALKIEKEYLDLKNSRIVLPPKMVKGKKRVRVILLSPEALKLVQSKKGEGKLFKTLRGEPYSKDIVRQRFRKLEKTLGFRYCLTHFRHAFAHRSLAAGNDAVTVATLLGHSSLAMIVRVYGHMNQADQHLRAALKKTK